MFKKHITLKELLHDDPAALVSYVMGSAQITVFFITLGALLLLFIKFVKPTNTGAWTWLALSLIMCAISRLIGILCTWDGYLYTINGIFCNVVGLASVVSLVLMIPIVKRIRSLKSMDELSREIENVKEKLRLLQNLKNDNARE